MDDAPAIQEVESSILAVLNGGAFKEAAQVALPAAKPVSKAKARLDSEEKQTPKVGDAEQPKEKAPPFELPNDRTGELLGKVLPPRHQAARQQREKSKQTSLPPFVQPSAPLPPGVTVVARLPDVARKGMLQPRGLMEERFEGGLDAPLPKSVSFVAEKKTFVPSEDVSIPPPLPMLAQPVRDRVATDDFTQDASTQAVLTAPLPHRGDPAPFTKAGIPEPFENRKPLGTKSPDEQTTPVTDGPTVPGK